MMMTRLDKIFQLQSQFFCSILFCNKRLFLVSILKKTLKQLGSYDCIISSASLICSSPSSQFES